MSNVNTQIESLVNSILGSEPSARIDNQFTGGQRPTTVFTTGIPLGSHVPLKIKEKIWNNDFIDIGSLLPKNINIETWSVTFSSNEVTVNTKQNNTKQKHINSFTDWIEAFNIFMAIFIQRFPDQAPFMLKYISIIKEIHDLRGLDACLFYDETFRTLRKEHQQQWQVVIDDIYRRAMFIRFPQVHNNKRHVNYQHGKRQNQSFLGQGSGTCHIFSKYESCTRKHCPYPHVCRNCRGPHPVTKCPKSHVSPDKNNRSIPSITKPNKP